MPWPHVARTMRSSLDQFLVHTFTAIQQSQPEQCSDILLQLVRRPCSSTVFHSSAFPLWLQHLSFIFVHQGSVKAPEWNRRSGIRARETEHLLLVQSFPRHYSGRASLPPTSSPSTHSNLKVFCEGCNTIVLTTLFSSTSALYSELRALP